MLVLLSLPEIALILFFSGPKSERQSEAINEICVFTCTIVAYLNHFDGSGLGPGNKN